MLRYLLALIIIMNGIVFSNTEHYHNVGTVLFSNIDMDKRRWNTDEIGLLKARRYFQNLIPPPLFLSTLNENYVDLMFNYFREAYSAIKNETNDPNIDRTMTTALSDSIGGYLKAWVLPVTKFAFYGGTISEQNVTKLFEFYDEIKTYLHTDGDGWHKPKTNLFDVSIKSVNTKLPTIAEKKNTDPCDRFVYFEKTPEGLNVPIPHVSWDEGASKLFLPLKDQSIYAMNSTNSSLVLLKYYEMARYCLQRRYPTMLNNFEARFQSWLANEVLPHLDDESVYLALGSVLTVMNKSRELYGDVLYMYQKKPKASKNTQSFAFSKKMLIVTLLIVIEVVWCCVALMYTCYTKKKKNKESQVYHSVDDRRPGRNDNSHFTQEVLDKPCKDPINECDCTPKGAEAVQTNIDTLFMRGKSCNQKCICHPGFPNIVTQSIGIVTGDSSIATHRIVHDKQASKRNSQSTLFSPLCRSSTSYTAVPIYSSQTVINTVSLESNSRSKHNIDKLTNKKVKHVKNIESNKIDTTHAVTETRKSKKDIKVPRPQRELKKDSSRNELSEAFKPTIFPDITKIVTLKPPSKEQSIDTTDFIKSEYFSHTTGTQNSPLAIILSKNLNTDLSINNHMKNEEIQCIKAVKTSVNPTKKKMQAVSFMKKECNSKALSGSYAGFIAYAPEANIELVKKETLIIEKPVSIKAKPLESLAHASVSKKRSVHTLGPQKIIEKSRNENLLDQQFTTYPSQQKFDKHCKDPKSKSPMKIEPKVSKPKRSKKLEFLEGAIRPSSSMAKTKKPAKPDSDTKSARSSIQKEFKDRKPERYWEITIDEPQKDVYVDIKGTITIDSRKVMKSRIPKLSVTTAEPRTTPNTPRANRAGSHIPQPRKKAVDDLVLKTSAERNKLNTTI